MPGHTAGYIPDTMVTLISNKKILTKFYIYACSVNILLRLLVCWRIIRSFSALILASTLSSLYIQIVDKMHKWHELWSLFSLLCRTIYDDIF